MATDQYTVLGKAPGSDELKKLSLSDPHLTIKKLSAGYGKMEILHDFNLFVSEAQSLCLIGPNGAGIYYSPLYLWIYKYFFRTNRNWWKRNYKNDASSKT